MLDDARIQQLFAGYRPNGEYSKWLSGYEAFLREVRAKTDGELESESGQRSLWRARAITGLGPGEAIDVSGAYVDPAVAAGIVDLRRKTWPSAPAQRAAALQAEYDRLLALVERHTKSRPLARLARVFAALLPEDMHSAFKKEATKHLRDLVLGDSAPDGVIASSVLVRDRLRSILGKEQNLADHVRRSTFCWWLHEQYDAITKGQAEVVAIAKAPNEVEPTLSVWPFLKQYKGIPAVKGYADSYRAIVQASLAGADAKEIAEFFAADPRFAGFSSNTRTQIIAAVKRCGLVEMRDGLLFPTPAGEDFLENETPDALVQPLLERFFPFAHLLQVLAEKPLAASALYARLRLLYPKWTTDMAPSAVLAWSRDVGLVELRDGTHRLSGYGSAWLARLPEDLPMPSVAELSEPASESEPQVSPTSKPWPSLATMLDAFKTDPKAKRLVLSDDQLVALHTAWHCHPRKRFVILSGLSGTGKTAIVRHYARLYSAALGLDVAHHLAVVAVSPDWRDPAGLLGYFNPLHEDPTFQVEPALELVLRAARDPSRPYFLLLDEMNLARVERYFAPFLSSMETGEPLVLHPGDERLDEKVPPRVPWPTNLFIAGTVNMDETTHPFSDKVLDRAFTLEFWDVDLDQYFATREARSETVEKLLLELHAALRPVRRHFGYRTAEELLAFAGTTPNTALLDQGVFSKILPRIRGEDGKPLRAALEKVQAICKDLPRSRQKVADMTALLETTGLTRFWA